MAKKKRNISKRKSKKMADRWADKKNPPMRTKAPAGWIPASAVKIKRNRGKIEVYIRKRPARRKTTTRKKGKR